ncbi:hypothetical protein BaRGS_00030932 [Batillaria attramentaria]|uniref:Uncharacterized protein n=1 Tax=Batillaria attramentaria TaxID=370345 RepID=A0ABD0JT58_9CAEN
MRAATSRNRSGHLPRSREIWTGELQAEEHNPKSPLGQLCIFSQWTRSPATNAVSNGKQTRYRYRGTRKRQRTDLNSQRETFETKGEPGMVDQKETTESLVWSTKKRQIKAWRGQQEKDTEQAWYGQWQKDSEH